MAEERLQVADTIVAESTPKGTGPISIIRVSGENTFSILAGAFGISIDGDEKRKLFTLFSGDRVIDEALIQFYSKPSSYTGENMAEIGCHGNPRIVRDIIDTLIKHGARQANPGEFSFRAYMNDKLSIHQAESIIGVIESNNLYDLSGSTRALSGKVTIFGSILPIISELTLILANIEAMIDFPDDLEDSRNELLCKLSNLNNELTKLNSRCFSTSRTPRLVIVGNRNTGKSSIFNALIGWPRAIVSSEPGTTRDFLNEVISIDGHDVEIFDTAGSDDQLSAIEKMGVDISSDIILESDLILIVRSIDRPDEYKLLSSSQSERGNRLKIINVVNKMDLFHERKNGDSSDCYVSVLSGDGLTELRKRIAIILSLNSDVDSMWISRRQSQVVLDAILQLEQAQQLYSVTLDLAILGDQLKKVLSTIKDVVPEKTNIDVVRKIFESFCVGK